MSDCGLRWIPMVKKVRAKLQASIGTQPLNSFPTFLRHSWKVSHLLQKNHHCKEVAYVWENLEKHSNRCKKTSDKNPQTERATRIQAHLHICSLQAEKNSQLCDAIDTPPSLLQSVSFSVLKAAWWG